MRERIEALAPSANLGHRGTGPTRPGHALPENSLPSFRAAMDEGADGIELDVELTADLQLVLMHDDTLDRTTTCSGCVSDWTLEAIREECRLLDGDGQPTDERPPTLEEVYATIPADALVNVELKVFEPPCLHDDNGPEVLARAATAEVAALGAAERTLFSSFDETAALAAKRVEPPLYSALLMIAAPLDAIRRAHDLGLDAVHPFYGNPADAFRTGLDLGLQMNAWTVNGASAMNATLDKGATTIITDEPAVLAQVIAERRR